MPKKKKITKRNKEKYKEVRPNLNLKSRYEELQDINDYFDTLPPKEKEWMNKFVGEYVNASFKKDTKHLHKTKKLKKACYDKNNSRNRDIMTKKKITASLNYLEDINKKDLLYNPEEEIIFVIDGEKKEV